MSAQIPFDVVTREIALPDPSLYAEEIQAEQPMDRFVDISDSRGGVALLNEGLKAYEAHEDAARTLSLTLLRSFPLRICITNLEMTDYSRQDKGSQCLGHHKFRYAFLPHEGNWEAAGLWQQAERFCCEPRVAQIGPTSHGSQPLAKSFLELDSEALHVSAVKQSESGAGWVVRLFNPTTQTIDCPRAAQRRIECPGHRSIAGRARAEFFCPTQAAGLALVGSANGHAWRKCLKRIYPSARDGWVAVKMAAKKILTMEFVPARRARVDTDRTASSARQAVSNFPVNSEHCQIVETESHTLVWPTEVDQPWRLTNDCGHHEPASERLIIGIGDWTHLMVGGSMPAAAEPSNDGVKSRQTMQGKVFCGYQGWFSGKDDGTGIDFDNYRFDGVFQPGCCVIDLWPDMSETDPDERYPTPFRHADGTTATVFSSANVKTVDRHFAWMKTYGIDGVFLQRFGWALTDPPTLRHRNVVIDRVRASAAKHDRLWAVMYDLTSLNAGRSGNS